MTPKQNNNWIPPRFWTVVIDTSIFNMLKLKLQGVHSKVYASFMSRALPGSVIPGLPLQTIDGQMIRLSDFRGRKHLVLEFGALT
ncbi:MAG: hypothetical protein HY646_05535 [Acidobacteria bacterium]|nr:hypothetical protein [Acidobacteriota bacterium]